MKLYGYWRSSAAYRVRIGLNLKGLEVEHTYVSLPGGEQRGDDYLRVNPQGLVPTLIDGDVRLSRNDGAGGENENRGPARLSREREAGPFRNS